MACTTLLLRLDFNSSDGGYCFNYISPSLIRCVGISPSHILVTINHAGGREILGRRGKLPLAHFQKPSKIPSGMHNPIGLFFDEWRPSWHHLILPLVSFSEKAKRSPWSAHVAKFCSSWKSKITNSTWSGRERKKVDGDYALLPDGWFDYVHSWWRIDPAAALCVSTPIALTKPNFLPFSSGRCCFGEEAKRSRDSLLTASSTATAGR